MKIRLHMYDNSQGNEENAIASPVVTYIPKVGEYFKLSQNGSWFQIQLVVHNLYPDETPEFEADVYAEKVEYAKVLKAAGHKGKR
jgi:hypothetical protein